MHPGEFRNTIDRAAGLAIGGTILAASLAMVACVSERTTGPSLNASGCNVQLPPDAFGSSVVIVRDLAFNPAQVSIKAGTKVTWVNCDGPGLDSHTSTSDTGVWSSTLLPSGATFTREFPAAGAFPYHCETHPGMTGTVTVQ